MLKPMHLRKVVALALSAVGGVAWGNSITVDPVTGETICVFDTVGDFSWTASANQTVQLLVVGGGGGGGCGNAGGGGGGGQVYYSSEFTVTKGTTYSGTVGDGGKGGVNNGSSAGRMQGDNGGDSVFGEITCPGGGGGGGHAGSAIRTGAAGGNSGGASCINNTYTSPDATGADDPGNGWYGGHKGGSSLKGQYSGGGGGATGEGGSGYQDQDGLNHSGNGGDGYECAITGATVYYGCGGGAGCSGGASSPYTLTLAGGDGGSGNASGGEGAKTHKSPGSAATANTGSGGGGGGWNASSPTVGGNGGSGIVVLRYVPAVPIVELTDVERFQDGEEAGVGVTVSYPASGYHVRYGDSSEGPWSETPITRSCVGTTEVWVKVSAPEKEDFIGSATVTLKDPSAENDGSFYFVVPEGTPGNVPTAPYQTWATAANGLKDVMDATATRMTAFSVLVQNGTYPVSEPVAIENEAATVRAWTPVTGKLVRGGAVFDADGKGRVASSTAAALKGLAFVNGRTVDMVGAGLYMTGPSAGGVLTSCVFSNNYISASAGNTTTISRGGGAYATVAVTATDCVFVDNVVTAATDTVTAYGGGMHVAKGTASFSGCTFLRNVASANKSGGGPVGAGLTCAGRLLVDDCDFLTNKTPHVSGSSSYAAALMVNSNLGTNSRVSNSRFIGNVAKEFGIIKLPYAGSVVTNCLFKDNGYGNGGDGCAPIVVGCDFVGNSGSISYCEAITYRNCRFYGNATFGWLHQSGSSVLSCENCTFAKFGGSVVNAQNAQGTRKVLFTNCAFADNNKDFNYNAAALESMTLVATNCAFETEASTNLLASAADLVVAANLRFVDKAAGDLRIRPGSPLRESGKIMPWMAGACDFAGDPRVVDRNGRATPEALPDIGCYECQEHMPGLLLLLR